MGGFISLLCKDELKEKINKLYQVLKKSSADIPPWLEYYMKFLNAAFDSFNEDVNDAGGFMIFFYNSIELLNMDEYDKWLDNGEIEKVNQMYIDRLYAYRDLITVYKNVNEHISLLDQAIKVYLETVPEKNFKKPSPSLIEEFQKEMLLICDQ